MHFFLSRAEPPAAYRKFGLIPLVLFFVFTCILSLYFITWLWSLFYGVPCYTVSYYNFNSMALLYRILFTNLSQKKSLESLGKNLMDQSLEHGLKKSKVSHELFAATNMITKWISIQKELLPGLNVHSVGIHCVSTFILRKANAVWFSKLQAITELMWLQCALYY